MKDRDSSRKDFVSEAEEIIEELTSDIQQLEASAKKNSIRPELINKIFREFHSLKGISGMLGFQKISSFTHEMENMLDRLRLGKIAMEGDTIDVLYQSLDMLNRLIGELVGDSPEVDTTSLLRTVYDVSSKESRPHAADYLATLALDEQTRRSLTEYEEHRLRENVRSGVSIYSIRFVLDNATFDEELREITKILGTCGEVISTLPSFDPAEGLDRMIFQLLYGSPETAELLLQRLGRTDVGIRNIVKTDVAPLAVPVQEEETEKTIETETSLKSLSPTVRVDIQKLDDVMNIIGELHVIRTRIAQTSRDLTSLSSTTHAGLSLARATSDLEKKLNELQRNVVEARLVPVGQVYHKLARLVRKLSRQMNKEIELVLSGEDTELDKIMIERLSDPLMHLMRNAIDHGIETPQERTKNGKSEKGMIRLSAFQRGNQVVIQIEDDGRGIQIARVAEQAKKRGLIGLDESIDMDLAIDLIFRPGFSSSQEITELSGRGVGLDVVKKNIAELKGSIIVTSEQGRGSTFEITLPITLAIIQALIVKIAGNSFAIPLDSVAELARIAVSDLQTVERKEVYCLRDQTLPVIRLDQFFRFAPANHRNELCLVIVKNAEKIFALTVDELLGQQEIVIKSIGEKLKNIPGLAGATEIGERRPVLVLDPESIVQASIQGTMQTA